MPLLLVAIFIGIPIIEIAIFIQAGEIIGLWPTLATVVLTAIVGTALLRAQGLAALARARQSIDRGQLPVDEVFTGICILLGGALLLTPGFLTDAVGFLLLVPGFRRVAGRRILAALFGSPNTRVWVDGEEVISPRHGQPHAPPDAIDVDFTEVRGDAPDDDKPGETGR